MKNYKDKLNKLINYFNNNQKKKYFNYPLLDDALSNEDIIKFN